MIAKGVKKMSLEKVEKKNKKYEKNDEEIERKK